MVDPAPITGQAIFAVIIVLALLAGVAWFLSRTAASRRSKGAISVETAYSLGERRSLVLVTVE